MNKPIPTSNETFGFSLISDFVFPQGLFDDEAVNLLLKAYTNNLANDRGTYKYNNSSHEEKQVYAIGLLLRMLPSEHVRWHETMAHWYEAYRMEHNNYFDYWFSDLDAEHRDAAKEVILKMQDGAPAMPIRVALLMDGMEHYPDLPVQSFIGKSLLRVKPAAFVKSLKTKLNQMPKVLKLGNDIKAIAPNYASLGNAIILSVFVQRMSEKPSSSTKQTTYSACEAFMLLIENNIDISPRECVDAAKIRLKGSALISDMLGYVDWSIGKDAMRYVNKPGAKDKQFALALAECLLDDILKSNPSEQAYDDSLMALHQAYPKTAPKVLEWLTKRLTKGSPGERVLVYVLDHLADQKEHAMLWAAWLKSGKSESFSDTFKTMLAYSRYQMSYSSTRYLELFRDRMSVDETLQSLNEYALALFDAKEKIPKMYSSSYGGIAQQKIDQEKAYMQLCADLFRNVRLLSSEQVRSAPGFKSVMASAAMAYLHFCSESQHAFHEARNGNFVNISSEPLPLLGLMYPDQTPPINIMRKEIIRKNTESVAQKPQDYYSQLYHVLGSAIYTGTALDKKTVTDICSAMNVNAYTYFSSALMQTQVTFDVPEDLFNMSF